MINMQRIMGKINDLLIADSENYISALLAEKLPENIIFHNFNHAIQVKKYAETIGEQAGLTADEMNILRISALFHDAGYVNSFEKYNEESIAIASAFLAEHKVDPLTIDHISEIIGATRLPQEPKDKIAEVLCDADMMYIASESCIEQFDLLNDENAMSKPKHGKRPAIEKGSIDFFTSHTYFTEYGKTILQPKKEAAVKRISERLNRRKRLESKKENPEKNKIAYSRGVESMFRITARNQINLNSIADNKSNILISVNAIIISIIITMLAGNIGNMSKDILPILVFLVICLITIIIAILSTRPNLITSKFTGEDIKNKKVDLIFFGNFIKIEYDDYVKALKDMMKDEEYLYSTLIKNQYALGKILAKKFRLIKIAYNVFMIGIIITVVVFLVNYFVIHR
jgi:predicted metal-dependent HD superfamily phosphohydrolase